MQKTTYTVDRENKTIHVDRTFDAPLAQVWQAWTDHTIMDQWWAPKPWHARTKTMDVRPGGMRLYAMVSPEGQDHWSKQEFRLVEPMKRLEWQDCFCDEQGNRNMAFPTTHWQVDFTGNGHSTRVHTTMTFETIEALEQLVNMGFKEGYAMAHENLDAILKS